MAVDVELFQDIKQLIPDDPDGLVFFQKAIHKIIVHAAENILPGYHEFIIDSSPPKVTYVGPSETETHPFTEHTVKQGDRLLIVGKKNNGAFAKYVHLSGRSIVVQLVNGELFNPSPNSVKVVKPKRKFDNLVSLKMSNPFSNVAAPFPAIRFSQAFPVNLPVDSTGNSGGVTTTVPSLAVEATPKPVALEGVQTTIASSEKNDFLSLEEVEASLPNANSSPKEDPVKEDSLEVDIEKNERLPAGNYDFNAEKFRRLSSYPTVEISENLTQEVYRRMRNAQRISLHIGTRKYPEMIKNTNWVSHVNAYMNRSGYNDPRRDYLINIRSKSSELWECPGGFDFLDFLAGTLQRNKGFRYGHLCILSIVLDNTWYQVRLYV
jgi:hypothetical protein